MCMYVPYVGRCPQKPEGKTRAGFIGGYEPPSMGAGNPARTANALNPRAVSPAVLRQGLTKLPKLALNFQYSGPSVPSDCLQACTTRPRSYGLF